MKMLVGVCFILSQLSFVGFVMCWAKESLRRRG